MSALPFMFGKAALVALSGLALACPGRAETPPSAEKSAPAPILTPRPGPAPRINGATVVGCTPGNPFLYRVPASGQRPLQFAARDLPAGLRLDEATGVISGKAPAKGKYRATIHVRNSLGRDSMALRIVSGDTLALTPPMGWNSWYCWSESVSAEKIVETARAMNDKGLADFGWSYVNIDDCWQGVRSGPLGALQGNGRFPDMKAMCDQVHALGLKVGIYSTPWMGTYAGFLGGTTAAPGDDPSQRGIPADQRKQPTQFFGSYPGTIKLKLNQVGANWLCDQDARQWAQWGIDFVKHDWLPNDVPTTERLAKGLRACGRDIVFSVSNDAPFANAKGISQAANLWRTGPDIQDTWAHVLRNGFERPKWNTFVSPGHWVDPDMLQIGMLGHPNQMVTKLRRTRLTPDEQYSQMSMWCLLSAPLILSCDIAGMDDFTLGLLTNREVIAINQDALGKAAMPVKEQKELWLKPLEGGAYALGVFNPDSTRREIRVDWSALGIQAGPWKVRDAWRQTDLATGKDGFATTVAPHGVTLVVLSRR